MRGITARVGSVDCGSRVAVVHDGVVENHGELRARLRARGHSFESDTDTEVVPHLVEEHAEDEAVEGAFRRAIGDLDGRYAVAMMVEDGEMVYAARSGSPLVIGVDGEGRNLASDVPAFLEFTDSVVVMEGGDVAAVSAGHHRIADAGGNRVQRPVGTLDWQAEDATKGEDDHYVHVAYTGRRRRSPGR